MATKGKRGPCWAGYKIAGMKKKKGRQVPNCIKASAKKKKNSKHQGPL